MTDNKTKRQSIVDLWRIVACFCLLTHHTYLVREAGVDYAGYRTLIFIDLFFILSGFYTAKHFLDNQYEDQGKESFEYFTKKFVAFLPYTTVAILIQYILDARQYAGDGIKNVIGSFYSMPLEMLFLSESYTQTAHLVPIWFLSAMFIAFPVLLIVLKIKDRYTVLFIAMIYSAVFYNFIGIAGSRLWPKDLFRALAGLLLGAMLFIISDAIKGRNKELSQAARWIYTIIECACLIIPLIVTFGGMQGWDKNIIIMFAAGIIIMTSDMSMTSKLSSPVLSYLGKLTMPVYICQWVTGSLLAILFNNMTAGHLEEIPSWIRVATFYLVTVIVAAGFYQLVEGIKRRTKKA